MSFRQVTRCAPPASSALSRLYRHSHLVDSFVVPLGPHTASIAMRHLLAAAVADPPAWLNGLMGLRDTLVAPFGIKTSAQIRDAIPASERVHFFRIIEERDNEIVFGERDSHLNFQASIMRGTTAGRAGDGEVEAYMTTVVQCNNWLGRVYLFIITPFHGLVVRAALARMRDRLQ